MARKTKGSKCDEVWTCFVRARSRALITTGSGHIMLLTLSKEVSISSHLERASAGAILVPGVTCQTMSKSCRNNDHRACHQDNLQGSFM